MPGTSMHAETGMPAEQASITFDRIFPDPSACVISARLDPGDAAWLDFDESTLDLMAAGFSLCCGEIPVICHEASTSPLVLDFLRDCGHEPGAKLLTYRNSAQLHALQARCIASGRRLINQHVPTTSLFPDHAYVVPVPLQQFLNDKSSLPQLVPAPHVPLRRVVSLAELGRMPFDGPVVLKPVSRFPTGGGCGVCLVRQAEEWGPARSRLSDKAACLQAVVVETFLDLVASWCAQVAISDDGIVYLGAPRQNIAMDGSYLGNCHGVGFEPPPGVEALARLIAERGRALGYRGFAGFDIGLTTQGPLQVFDLNFRVNGSLRQLLFDHQIRRSAGCSQNLTLKTVTGFQHLIDRVRPFVERGQYFPQAGIDGSRHPTGISRMSGYVAASDAAALQALEAAIHCGLAC